jgi:predicted DNA-binding transcriptional regulator AlpA
MNSDDFKVLRIQQVCALTALSRSSIYAKLSQASKQFDPTFPCSFKLGASAVGWSQSDIIAWLRARPYTDKKPSAAHLKR